MHNRNHYGNHHRPILEALANAQEKKAEKDIAHGNYQEAASHLEKAAKLERVAGHKGDAIHDQIEAARLRELNKQIHTKPIIIEFPRVREPACAPPHQHPVQQFQPSVQWQPGMPPQQYPSAYAPSAPTMFPQPAQNPGYVAAIKPELSNQNRR